MLIGCLYALSYLSVAALMLVLDWVVPHLPWIAKPYVSPDPPPLPTAFRCANFVLASVLVLLPILFVIGPKRQIRCRWPKKHENTRKP